MISNRSSLTLTESGMALRSRKRMLSSVLWRRDMHLLVRRRMETGMNRMMQGSGVLRMRRRRDGVVL